MVVLVVVPNIRHTCTSCTACESACMLNSGYTGAPFVCSAEQSRKQLKASQKLYYFKNMNHVKNQV